jgi:hypothetical protein
MFLSNQRLHLNKRMSINHHNLKGQNDIHLCIN